MNVNILKSYEEMSAACAAYAADFINRNPGSVVCFAAGDTPLGMFSELLRMQADKAVDLGSVYYVGLDEWVGLGYEDKGSCAQIMTDSFYTPAGLRKDRLVVFDGKADPEEETKRVLGFVEERGGIGLTVLGVGMNGHVGFNEPGTSDDFMGGYIRLSETSVTVGQKYFDRQQAPTGGVTIGLNPLLSAKSVGLLASGKKKAEIMARCLKDYDENLPASYFVRHPDLNVFMDEEAASDYSR